MAISDICRMQILLIAATRFEIESTIDYFTGMNNRSGSHEIAFLVTGIGLMSTTYSLLNQIHHFRPDCIIQAGIAGSFATEEPGRLMAIEEDTPADMGVNEEGHFKSIFDLKLADPNAFPFTKGFLRNPFDRLLKLPGLQKARAISVNEITTSKNRQEEYNQKFQPACESMEGAAFHYVCLLEEMPFLQIRAISNRIGERDKTKWNIKQALFCLNEKLISLITDLSKVDKPILHETISRI
jgi:futalosine hydrolase